MPKLTADKAMTRTHARSVCVEPVTRTNLAQLRRLRQQLEVEWLTHPSDLNAELLAEVYQALADNMRVVAGD